jgi:myosin heavy subunit
LQTELDTTADSYNTLKARAKAVASELKDRRIEVRTLSSQNEELTSSNASYETQLSNLRALVNQHELTIVYKDKDMDTLNEKIKDMGKEIEKGKDRSLQDRSVGEKAIASYKRKAQEALAAANARLAAANQAREEAESDAKNARSASDDAVERARVAEIKRSEAELKASKVNAQLEFEQMASSKYVNELKEFVESLNDTVGSLRAELEDATEKRVELVAELEQLNSDLSEQKEKNADLRDHMIQTNILCESLQKEVSDLNEEVQRSSAVAFKRAKDNGEASIIDNHADSRSFSNLSVNGVAIDRQESDGTIIMLQQELQGANEAIAELKLALRTALLERADTDYARDKAVSVRGAEALHGGGGGGESNTGNESTPLFFAIEKQNELKTARDEINRLANMLGDAECSKQEAYDAMEDMRLKMEEANSRLLRYERLGMKSARTQNSHHSNYGPFRSNALGGHSSVLGDDSRTLQAGSDSAVNLEYLKNIMLSFLTATTLADRRKLVPVVATVLCLTPEEQAQAIRSVERTAGLTGVASSFWENIESKAHNLTGI